MKNQNRVAIITGAGRGIGKAIAHRLVSEGIAVVIAEIEKESGLETEKQLSAIGSAYFMATDVRSERSVKNVVGRTLKKFGRIDVVVNNAARIAYRPLATLTLKEWDDTLATNLTGPMLMAKYCAPHLAKTKGVIINIASIRAMISGPDQEAYGSTKGGLAALTHCLAISLGPNVRVNSICPGWIDTSQWQKSTSTYRLKLRPIDHTQHPAGRVGRPEDIAETVAFLADPKNSFITGSNFVIDGGMMKKMMYVE